MAYIPADAKWYVADVILEIRIDGDRRNVVHVDTLLVRADSPQQAYEEARKLGRESANAYKNLEGKNVRSTFRGLGDLNVIHEDLERGAELFFSEKVGVAAHKVKAMITRKRDLAVFRTRKRTCGPDYMPASVANQLRAAGVSID